MQLPADLADRLYSLLVETVGASNDEYHRWSFIYAHSELTVTKYPLNSKFPNVVFLNQEPPVVVCDEPHAEAVVTHLNSLIREIVQPKKAKRVRRVPVSKSQPPVTVPVQRATASPTGSVGHA